MPECDSRFLDAELQPHLQEKKTQSRVDRSCVGGPFCLSQSGSTFSSSSPTDIQHKGIEQETWGGRTRFEGQV